jgi:hypothetical protein
MNFVGEYLVLNKNDRLHRVISSYLPAYEREEHYKPFQERTQFNHYKEFNSLMTEFKDTYTPKEDETHISPNIKLLEKSLKSLSSNSVFCKLSYFVSCNLPVKNSLIMSQREYRIKQSISSKGNKFLILYNDQIDIKSYRERTIEFLRENGFTLSGRERNSTLVKMLMSF